MENFNSLNLEKTLMDAIAVINFKTPTPIQAMAAIRHYNPGQDTPL